MRRGVERNYSAYRSKSEDRYAEENARYDAKHGRATTNAETKPSPDLVRFFMPFGKYKGRPIDDAPTQYLLWLLKQEFVKGRTRGSIADHLGSRLLPSGPKGSVCPSW